MKGYFLTWKDKNGRDNVSPILSKRATIERYLNFTGLEISELKFWKSYKNGKTVDITAKVNKFLND